VGVTVAEGDDPTQRVSALSPRLGAGRGELPR
jgi:hypothetical protein